MKLIYASDLHGLESRYRAVASAVSDARPDLVVLGGDLFPDETTLREDRRGHEQPDFVGRFFADWVARVSGDAALGVAVIFGNHDWSTSIEAVGDLAGRLPLHVLDAWTRDANATATPAPVKLGGIDWIGYSYSPPTPWHVKDMECLDRPGDPFPDWSGYRFNSDGIAHEVTAAEAFSIPRTLEADLARIEPPVGPWVLVAHAPPYESALDRKLDGEAIGSRAVRAAIERLEPMLSLHGHIHESPKVTGRAHETISRTICVNVGQGLGGTNVAEIELNPPQRSVIAVTPRVIL
jgi:Icc-related predicted phosphoesterase